MPPDYPIEITKVSAGFFAFAITFYLIHNVIKIKDEKTADYHIIEGKFLTPLELYLPGLVPEASRNAHFQMLLPLKWHDERFKPICIHFAGTGDHVSHFC